MLEIVAGVLRDGTDALDESGIPYWISAGTALGLYRDNNAIPGDSDIDIGVTSDISAEEVEETLLDAGFMAHRYRNHKGAPRQRAYVKEGVAFDVSFYTLDGEYYIFQTPYGVIEKPKHLLEDLHKISFKGKEYPIPNPQKYLKWRYGDWQTPGDSKGVYGETYGEAA